MGSLPPNPQSANPVGGIAWPPCTLCKEVERASLIVNKTLRNYASAKFYSLHVEPPLCWLSKAFGPSCVNFEPLGCIANPALIKFQWSGTAHITNWFHNVDQSQTQYSNMSRIRVHYPDPIVECLKSGSITISRMYLKHWPKPNLINIHSPDCVFRQTGVELTETRPDLITWWVHSFGTKSGPISRGTKSGSITNNSDQVLNNTCGKKKANFYP